MSLFFFHIMTSSGEIHLDETGVDLPDLSAVHQEARRTAEELRRDAELGGRDYSGCTFIVTSADGQCAFKLPISQRPRGRSRVATQFPPPPGPDRRYASSNEDNSD
jgi:hypothetical protein